MPLDKEIKIKGFGYKANTNLYQLKFTFTSGVESRTFNSMEGCSFDCKVHPIPDKTIRAVEINIRSEESNIYGIRFIDVNGNKL